MKARERVRHVLVDADACPRTVLDILRRLREEYGYRLVTVASFNHDIDGADHIMVGDGPDEADLALLNRTRRGDIVVTQDWGLAALVLSRGAFALSPRDHEYKGERIEFLLDERYKKAKARLAGLRTRGPARRTAEDDVRFERTLRRLFEQEGISGQKT